ncbi:10787_t:CDS:2 [Dentiscutata heterogama]|uniref:10787_t:CDS:1 n=1 Tax=Dentiscutata heterogama TaxID=1316150 RepID=A0ACA9L752_9GLOM|nr:10787_t:CDS:2 [Dentiscutata heterogama]
MIQCDILYLIFENLSDDNGTLANCIYVCRGWADIAVKILYRDPFKNIIELENQILIIRLFERSFTDRLTYDYVSFLKYIRITNLTDWISNVEWNLNWSDGRKVDTFRAHTSRVFTLLKNIFKRCGTLKYLGYCSLLTEIHLLENDMLRCIDKKTIIEIEPRHLKNVTFSRGITLDSFKIMDTKSMTKLNRFTNLQKLVIITRNENIPYSILDCSAEDIDITFTNEIKFHWLLYITKNLNLKNKKSIHITNLNIPKLYVKHYHTRDSNFIFNRLRSTAPEDLDHKSITYTNVITYFKRKFTITCDNSEGRLLYSLYFYNPNGFFVSMIDISDIHDLPEYCEKYKI